MEIGISLWVNFEVPTSSVLVLQPERGCVVSGPHNNPILHTFKLHDVLSYSRLEDVWTTFILGSKVGRSVDMLERCLVSLEK